MASGLSVEVAFCSAGLVPLIGKTSVTNITVPLGFAVVQKVLRWPVSRLWLAPSQSILYPPPASIRWHHTARLAGTSLLQILRGWHPNAPHRLVPYCYPLAGTLLPLIVGWHALCPVAPLAHLPLSLLRFTPRSQVSLSSRWVMVFNLLLGTF